MIIIDGLSANNKVAYEMAPTRVAQSVHAYFRAGISRYRAGWPGKLRTPHSHTDSTRRGGRTRIKLRLLGGSKPK